jgi:dTDP-4-dehydrorhamnose reductase
MTGRMLVTGASGHLGRRVAARAAAAGWSVTGTYATAPGGPAGERLDIRDAAAVRALLERVRPDVVVHTAAGRADWRVIADGAAHVAVAAAALGVRLVHLSSDAVFAGRPGGYDEAALPDPVYPYGAAKAAAETAVRAIVPPAVVVRTSLIVGGGDGGHEVLTHELIAGRREGVLFTDELRMPVHVDDLTAALLELAAGGYQGVLNVAGAEAVSRYELGLLVARRDGLDPGRLVPGRAAELHPGRPAEVRLDCRRAASLLRTRLRGAHEFMTAP